MIGKVMSSEAVNSKTVNSEELWVAIVSEAREYLSRLDALLARPTQSIVQALMSGTEIDPEDKEHFDALMETKEIVRDYMHECEAEIRDVGNA